AGSAPRGRPRPGAAPRRARCRRDPRGPWSRWGRRSSRAIRLDQHFGHLRTQDARIGTLALLELLAHLRPTDREGLLVGVMVGQIDAADRLVVGREADLAGTQLQLAGQIVEDVLGVEVAPDRLAVVERRVGVLAADHQIAEAVVLAVDGVHYRL